MRYISINPEDREAMLEAIGKEKVEDLFGSIPEGLRFKGSLDIPAAMDETSVVRYFQSLADRNAGCDRFALFLGAGAYNHFIPTVIDSIISRSEFYTAYTPYQPEISQGTLQSIFEYQTLICQLTGMDVANASLYDGGSALAEAVLMAERLTRRKRIILPASLHPAYGRVVGTYIQNLGFQVDELPFTEAGTVDLAALDSMISEEHAAVVLQSPNFFGVIEDIEPAAEKARSKGALTVVTVAEALSLGLLRPPGELGADIVLGEGQSFGIPLSFGGPYLGFFATWDRHKRQIPGRLVGQTVDSRGKRGFVLTLSTREQHIRREKATSNICTNQGLCALMAAIFLSTLGRRGLRQMAEQNVQKLHYLRTQLQDSVVFSGPCFNELVLRCRTEPEALNRRLFDAGIVGGLPLGRYFEDRKDQMLICVTEQNTRPQIDRFIELFREDA